MTHATNGATGQGRMTLDDLTKLAQQVVDGNPDSLDAVVIRKLVEQSTRLSEIVERLPKTKDGVPVGPGSLVYVDLSNTPRWRVFGVSTLYIEGWDTRTEVAVFRNTPEGNMPGELDSVFFEIEDTYSTPEAAEAARGEPDKEQR